VHELSYCDGVLEAVLLRAGGRRVSSVGVRIGAVHRVVAEAFQQSFAIAATGTVAADARTELTVLPVHGHCMDCRTDFHATDPAPACPGCGSFDVAVDGGDEVVLEWIGYDAGADVPATPIHPHTHDERV
jgi:hydrogenase nickel incorporation protein HypA/HybF